MNFNITLKNSEKYIQRLTEEWLEHGKIIIAIDFDDTISPWKLEPSPPMELIQLLQKAHLVGAYLVVFTACTPDRYPEIIQYCEKYGLKIEGINITPVQLPYGNVNKIYANIFLDDRAGLEEASIILSSAMYRVISKNNSINQHDIA